MKENVTIDDLLETSHFSKNLIKGINTWIISLVRFSKHLLKCTREKLRNMEHRSRKFMRMQKPLHSRDDIIRHVGEKRLVSTKDCIDDVIHGL